MSSVFSESNSRRICHWTSMSTLLVLSAFSTTTTASDVLLMTTLSLHSFMRSSQAESIIAAVSWWALDPKKTTDKLQHVLNSQHESSRTRASSGTHSFPAKSATLAGRYRPGSVQSLRPGVQMSAQDGSWIPVHTANPSPAFLVVDTCDRLTVFISTSHVWNLLRREDVHLHTPSLQTRTHFLITLYIETIYSLSLLSFRRHLKTFSSLSTIG